MSSATDALRRIVPRRLAQTVVVAPTVRPAAGFVLSMLWEDRPRTFHSRRLGHRVRLRPRADLHVAREFLSKYIYGLPPEVAAALAGRREPLRILDLGANIGMFSVSVIHALGAGTRVDAVEPDPDNLELLRANVALAGHRGNVTIHPAAAGCQAGSAMLVGGDSHNSHLLRPEEAPADATERVPVADAFELAAAADLIKIDIEGGEWELLRDPRLAQLPAAAIVLEWHWSGSGCDDPAAEVQRLLGAAGYEVGYAEQWPGNGYVWAWRAAASTPQR